jgi:hypothetical protein
MSKDDALKIIQAALSQVRATVSEHNQIAAALKVLTQEPKSAAEDKKK